jgi:hypothetical protein
VHKKLKKENIMGKIAILLALQSMAAQGAQYFDCLARYNRVEYRLVLNQNREKGNYILQLTDRKPYPTEASQFISGRYQAVSLEKTELYYLNNGYVFSESVSDKKFRLHQGTSLNIELNCD